MVVQESKSVDEKVHVLATPWPVKPRSESAKGLGDPESARHHRAIDKLKVTGPQLARIQALGDPVVAPWDLPALIGGGLGW